MIDRDELRRLCAQEPRLTYQQIAIHLGVSYQRIQFLAKQTGLAKIRPARARQPQAICPDCGKPKTPEATRCMRCSGAARSRLDGAPNKVGYIRLPRYLRKHFGIIFRHQLVAMWKIKRPLRPEEEVHHIDGNPLNNHPDNLMVVTRKQHIAIDRRFEQSMKKQSASIQ